MGLGASSFASGRGLRNLSLKHQLMLLEPVPSAPSDTLNPELFLFYTGLIGARMARSKPYRP